MSGAREVRIILGYYQSVATCLFYSVSNDALKCYVYRHFYTDQTRPLHLWSLIQRQGIKCGSLVLIFAPVSPPCGAGDTPDSVSVMLIIEMNIERRSNCAGVWGCV